MASHPSIYVCDVHVVEMLTNGVISFVQLGKDAENFWHTELKENEFKAKKGSTILEGDATIRENTGNKS